MYFVTQNVGMGLKVLSTALASGSKRNEKETEKIRKPEEKLADQISPIPRLQIFKK